MKTIEKLIIYLIIFFPLFCFAQNDIIADVVHSNISCNGLNDGIASVLPDGGTNPYSYEWSNGATTQTISNLVPSSYVVTVTDANGLTAMNGTVIEEPQLFVVNIVGINGLCGDLGAADAFAIGGTTPYSYSWSNLEETNSIDNLPAGNYKVTATDRNGCEAIENINIIIDENKVEFEATINSPSCNGQQNGSIEIEMTNGTAPYMFIWNNEVSTKDQSNLGIGSYTVFIKDANGCNAGQTFSIQQPDALNLRFINDDEALIGRVTGGITPYTYKWSTGLTGTPVLSNIGLGTYGLTVTDANGCSIIGEGDYLGPLSDSYIEAVDHFSISPNPASDFFQVHLESANEENIELNLINLYGQIVLSNQFTIQSSVNQNISLENVSPGTYFVVTKIDGRIVNSKQLIVLK